MTGNKYLYFERDLVPLDTILYRYMAYLRCSSIGEKKYGADLDSDP